MGLELLIKQLRESPVVIKGDYRYIINPITEQEPALHPSILDDCANRLLKKMNWQGATKVLTAEAMGIPITTAISLKTGIPMVIATRRLKRTPDEIEVEYICGYEKGYLHINNIKPEDKVLIIDDLISTAGTIVSMIDGINRIGAQIMDIGTIFNKVDYSGMDKLQKMGFSPKTLLNVKLLEENKLDVWEC